MKVLIVGRSEHRNKMFMARLRQHGVPDSDMYIVKPAEFDSMVSASPDTHFMCVYVNDSRWYKEDEYRLFHDRMEAPGYAAENCRLYQNYFNSKDTGSIYSLYHMWQNLTKMVEALVRNGNITMNEGKVVVYLNSPDGFPCTALYSIDNFVSLVSGEPELMHLCVSAYLQNTKVIL